MNDRNQLIGEVIETLVTWARVLDSRELFPIAGEQLTRQQAEVLFLLAYPAEPVTPSLLAERLRITRGAVTQLVAGLVAAGLVVQSAATHDRRRRVLALTDEARDKIDDFEGQVVARLANRFDALDDGQLGQLAVLLAQTRGDK